MNQSITTYSPRSLANAIGFPYKTVLAAISTGQLKCAKANKRVYRIRSEDAAKWFVSINKSDNSPQVG